MPTLPSRFPLVLYRFRSVHSSCFCLGLLAPLFSTTRARILRLVSLHYLSFPLVTGIMYTITYGELAIPRPSRQFHFSLYLLEQPHLKLCSYTIECH
ncbi:hypothetical protein F5148DRAFT_699805 [Russula earlei]|uniref:Uncharacterized protein n=1 Tax=Russula earlei TaxID=71964 RepID=A0ACC0UEK6_9AGAM|nr:hypothetical protein F5148DRAFT_699805 [Russula earlei]